MADFGFKTFSWLTVLLAPLLAGCVSAPVSQDLRAGYIGMPVDTFFLERGGPVSSFPYGKGGRVYLWFSGRGSAYQPGDRGTVDLIGNTAWWKGYSLRSYNPLLECRLDILADSTGTIAEIRMHGGERDWRDRQRCREVFGWGGRR